MRAQLLIDAHGADIRHRTGISAPDDFYYIKTENGIEYAFFDAREFEVQREALAKLESPIRVERLEPYRESAKAKGRTEPERDLLEILDQMEIDTVEVSHRIPLYLAEALKAAGHKVVSRDFSVERRRKTDIEIGHIRQAQRVNESAFDRMRTILRESKIERGLIMWRGSVLTSEILKFEAAVHLLREGYTSPEGMIIASGEQTACPHNTGSGPILPHQPIIVDLFPRDTVTGYFGDMTRMWVKGKATPQIIRMHQAIHTVQEATMRFIEPGVAGIEVYQEAVNLFAKLVYPELGPESGFNHGLGHPVGLELHDVGVRLSHINGDGILGPGDVATDEPGLYYPGLGGGRIEDIVAIHEDGTVEDMTNFDKELVIP